MQPFPTLPRNLSQAVVELAHILERHRIRYCLVGGVAAGFRSEPRFTSDIDFLLEVPQLVLPGLLNELHERGFTLDLESAIRNWIQESMIAFYFRDVRIDWLKPVLPCYQHALDRGSIESWTGVPIRVSSAESLILIKLLAFRTQDQLDIENLVAANCQQLDLDWIKKEWETVAEFQDPRMLWLVSKVESCLRSLASDSESSDK